MWPPSRSRGACCWMSRSRPMSSATTARTGIASPSPVAGEVRWVPRAASCSKPRRAWKRWPWRTPSSSRATKTYWSRRPNPLLAALRAAAARGTRLISICTGAFALAWAGLLDGRRATTHWRSAAQLAARFPSLSVDDGDILTSAGVAAGLDLCLHVVRQDHGAAAAASIARWTVVAPHRDGGQAQFIERPIAEPDDTASLSATLTWALERLGERLDLARLADHACVSPRTFSRRFRAETGTTPLQWLLSQRVSRGLQLLEHTDLPVSAVAHACGFADAAAFRRHLGRATGTTPATYRRAFRPEPDAAGGQAATQP